MTVSHRSAVTVRAADPADFEAIAVLTIDVYIGGGYVSPESPYAATLADTAARADAAEIVVAVDGDTVVGSVTIARPGTPYAHVARPRELEFRMLAVAKAARGRGIGTALVRQVLATAAAEGFEAVVLATTTEMADAIRVYERLGFVYAPERDREVAPSVELLVMVRDRSGARAATG